MINRNNDKRKYNGSNKGLFVMLKPSLMNRL